MAKSMSVRLAAFVAISLCGSASGAVLPGYATTYEVVTPPPASAKTVTKGASVTVHATGIVAQTDKKFWSTKDPGQKPFTYKAGMGSVITGWDQGCLGMGLGEVRKLTIPANEG